jgi:DNA-binding transcriptional MerR regulator
MPIRPVVAADLLDLTEKTVRAWANEGVLLVSEQEPTMRLEPRRVHEVLHLVREIRRIGRTRGLLDEVHRRLSDQALLEREDLAESLDQVVLGEGTVVRPGTKIAE